MPVPFSDWTGGRALASYGTNDDSPELAFQHWRRFKEAFAPELIARAVGASHIPVERCLDPFGGSGTTALACQFLGVHPVTVEVNPFLVDLIRAKVSTYDVDSLVQDLGVILGELARRDKTEPPNHDLPRTFVEPGSAGRWIFNRAVFDRIWRYRLAIESLASEENRRLFRVLLGGILIDVSNVLISGKGRRYRRRWLERPTEPGAVDARFIASTQRAIAEINRFGSRKCLSFDVRGGDVREGLSGLGDFELAVFSPPYPNSFDYTDIYNVELWMLGYLENSASNQRLRRSTLSSHVQIGRQFASAPGGSRALTHALGMLEARRPLLWNQRLPEMIGGYFADLMGVLDGVLSSLRPGGTAWMVVGNSAYSGVEVPTAAVICELASTRNWPIESVEACRSMRASPQQGGRHDLAETLIVLAKP